MKSIQIRETPAEVYAALSAAAEREGRSLSQQALVFLSKGAEVAIAPKHKRKELLSGFEPLKISKKFNVAKELREDRSR